MRIIGIMGATKATKEDLKNAYEIGKYCAKKGYATLTGGLKYGVMEEGLRGAKENNGLTIGIMPTDNKDEFSKYADIPVVTTMKAGRSYIEILTSDIIVACGVSAGTSSEISLAIKPNKKIILVNGYEEANVFYKKLAANQIFIAKDYSEAIQLIEELVV